MVEFLWTTENWSLLLFKNSDYIYIKNQNIEMQVAIWFDSVIVVILDAVVWC